MGLPSLHSKLFLDVTGKLASLPGGAPPDVLAAVFAMDMLSVDSLILYAGCRGTAWTSLALLGPCCMNGGQVQRAGAYFLQCMARKNVYEAAREARELYSQAFGPSDPHTIACTFFMGKGLSSQHRCVCVWVGGWVRACMCFWSGGEGARHCMCWMTS